MFFATRVGEASNPGPESCTMRLMIANPTAIHKKVDRLLKTNADIITTSETSATNIIQKEISHELKAKGFRSFWSPPVAPKKQTNDHRPSYRGEALGTAIFSRIPCRVTRAKVPTVLQDSQRFTSCVIRFGCFEVLLVCVYGFANRYLEGKRPNDLLLASIASFVGQIGLPFLICGDFNEPPTKLASFQLFKEVGAVEVFQWYQSKFGSQLPPTCAGSTRNDTAIIHPKLLNFITDIQVLSEHQFDIHTPLQIEFQVDSFRDDTHSWHLPKTWAPFSPPKEIIETFYEPMDWDNIQQGEFQSPGEHVHKLFQEWSQHVEKAIDRSLYQMHKQDHQKFPRSGLQAAYKGRCNCNKPKKHGLLSPIKSDRHGGYTPPTEVCTLQSRLKIRQVRRLQSLYRRLKALPLHHSSNPADIRNLCDASQEWKKILNAKGYGNSWQNWILSFEVVTTISLQLPSIEQLEILIEVTKHDCNHSCFEESRQRADAFKCKLQIDQEHDFSRMTYKIVKAKESLTLNEVPVTRQANYKLLRCQGGNTCLRLDRDVQVPKHAKTFLDEVEIEVLQQQGNKIFFRVLTGTVSASGTFKVVFTALTPAEIMEEFNSFWTPFWQRDGVQEQFDDNTWQDFHQKLDECKLPLIPQIPIDFRDEKKWIRLIRKLPSGKAVGPCGWSNDELKCLPPRCIKDLLRIFEVVSTQGFGHDMMMAKAVLLSKIAIPKSMHHARPVTILSSLYRLYSKMIFQTIAHVWKRFFPPEISGGMPGRGVKEIAYAQKREIEESIADSMVCGGMTMDLIKAFNTFGRHTVGQIMVRLGIPQVVIDSWITSLSVMVRYPTLNQHVGQGISSTTGVPEGCSISVLAMMATSCFFYFRLVTPKIQPYTYADNWSWLSKEQKAHFQAFDRMQETVRILRLQLDTGKSWHWATTKQFRDACEKFHRDNPQIGNIQVKTSTKDLGEMVHYGKAMSLGFIRDKITEATGRMKKIEWIPATLQKKAMMIQATCWPLALYTTDTTYLGQQHFTALRRAVVSTLVGYWHTSSPFLTCSMLSRHVSDPFLFTLCTCFRTIRRLANVQWEKACQTIKRAANFGGSRPIGPATTFRCYLNSVGWQLKEDGTVIGPDGIRCNVLCDTTKHLTNVLR